MSNYKFEFCVLCKQNNIIFRVESEKQKCLLDYVSLLQLCPVTRDFDHSHWANTFLFFHSLSLIACQFLEINQSLAAAVLLPVVYLKEPWLKLSFLNKVFKFESN